MSTNESWYSEAVLSCRPFWIALGGILIYTIYSPFKGVRGWRVSGPKKFCPQTKPNQIGPELGTAQPQLVQLFMLNVGQNFTIKVIGPRVNFAIPTWSTEIDKQVTFTVRGERVPLMRSRHIMIL